MIEMASNYNDCCLLYVDDGNDYSELLTLIPDILTSLRPDGPSSRFAKLLILK